MLNELIQLEQNELQLQLKLKTNRALITGLDQVKDGIIITSSNNEIEFTNKSIEKLLGYKSDELLGKNIHELIHRLDLSKVDLIDSINMQVHFGKVRVQS